MTMSPRPSVPTPDAGRVGADRSVMDRQCDTYQLPVDIMVDPTTARAAAIFESG